MDNEQSFLDKLLSPSNDVSSKRVLGSIGFIATLTAIIFCKQEYLNECLYVSGALLGLGIFDKKFNK